MCLFLFINGYKYLCFRLLRDAATSCLDVIADIPHLYKYLEANFAFVQNLRAATMSMVGGLYSPIKTGSTLWKVAIEENLFTGTHSHKDQS